jgi:hypothetical protein
MDADLTGWAIPRQGRLARCVFFTAGIMDKLFFAASG